MPPPAPLDLTPRKLPRQTRAFATVETIFEAAIQVLISDGPRRYKLIPTLQDGSVRPQPRTHLSSTQSARKTVVYPDSNEVVE